MENIRKHELIATGKRKRVVEPSEGDGIQLAIPDRLKIQPNDSEQVRKRKKREKKTIKQNNKRRYTFSSKFFTIFLPPFLPSFFYHYYFFDYGKHIVVLLSSYVPTTKVKNKEALLNSLFRVQEAERNASKKSWQNFVKKQKRKTGFMTNVKRSSQFSTPEGAGKVGVVNAGKGMTKNRETLYTPKAITTMPPGWKPKQSRRRSRDRY